VLAIHFKVPPLIFICTLTFVAGFAISTGPVPYVYITETCCAKGLSFGVFNIWLGTIIVSFITPFLINGIELIGTFIFYGSFSIAGCFAFIFLLKETKGLSEIEC